MTAKQIINILHKNGWQEVHQRGSHIQFKHPSIPGKVTVPIHSGDIPKGTLHTIYKQARLK